MSDDSIKLGLKPDSTYADVKHYLEHWESVDLRKKVDKLIGNLQNDSFHVEEEVGSYRRKDISDNRAYYVPVFRVLGYYDAKVKTIEQLQELLREYARVTSYYPNTLRDMSAEYRSKYEEVLEFKAHCDLLGSDITDFDAELLASKMLTLEEMRISLEKAIDEFTNESTYDTALRSDYWDE